MSEYDWAHDPYFLSFADHIIAAMNLVWAHEQKVARAQQGVCEMNSGLLWYDKNAGTKLMDVIDDAAKRYREKFGFAPDICFVNAAQLEEFEQSHRDALPRTRNLAVLPNRNVIRDHVWIGISAPAPTSTESAAFEKAKQDAVQSGAPRVAHLYRTPMEPPN